MPTNYIFKKTSLKFYEKQKYKNLPLLLMLFILEFVLCYFILQEILADHLWGIKSFQTWFLIVFTALIPTPLLLSFIFVRLETIISEDGIFFRWRPFKRNYHMILWDGIRDVTLIPIKSRRFYWNFTKNFSEANFPASKFGLVITMKSGRKRLIGTQRAEEVNRILARLAGPKYIQGNVDELFSYD